MVAASNGPSNAIPAWPADAGPLVALSDSLRAYCRHPSLKGWEEVRRLWGASAKQQSPYVEGFRDGAGSFFLQLPGEDEAARFRGLAARGPSDDALRASAEAEWRRLAAEVGVGEPGAASGSTPAVGAPASGSSRQDGGPWPPARVAPQFLGGRCDELDVRRGGPLLAGSADGQPGHLDPVVQRPLVLRGLADRIFPAAKRWDFDFLVRRAGDAVMDGVRKAQPGTSMFDYADETNLRRSTYSDPSVDEQRHPPMKVKDFVRKVREAGKDGSPYYLWSALYQGQDEQGGRHQGVGGALTASLQDDISQINWSDVDRLAELGGFGSLSTIQLFVSGAGAVTASHYDQSQNVFLQVRGVKRFIMFPPIVGARALAPFPVRHPRDRNARVRLGEPDYGSWPQLARAHGGAVEAVLEPGDGLFLPYGWWHHVESLDSENVSVNFWFRGGAVASRPPERVPRPLPEPFLLDLARHAELFLAKHVTSELLGPFLLWMQLPQAIRSEGLPPEGEELHWLRCANLLHYRASELVPLARLAEWLELLDARRFAWLELRDGEAGLVEAAQTDCALAASDKAHAAALRAVKARRSFECKARCRQASWTTRSARRACER